VKFDVIIGNPPYQAPRGYKTSAAYKDVDGKHGCKRLYYFFTKLGVELLAEDGICMFVQPPNWRASKDGTALRLWIRAQCVVYETLGLDVGGAFKDVMTAADIQTFRRGTVADSRWHGRAAIFTERDWQRAWIDAAEGDPTNRLAARRGGYREDASLPLTTVYETYKRGIITAQRRVAPLADDNAIIFPGFSAPYRKNFQKAEIVEAAPVSINFIIILPEFRAPYKKNFQKAEIVEAAPASGIFIILIPHFLGSTGRAEGNLKKSEIVEALPHAARRFHAIDETRQELERIMTWIRSKPFFDAMDSFHGSTHLGTDHFITEEAFNIYVKEHYDRETRSL